MEGDDKLSLRSNNYEPFAFGYAVHDLDGDGRLELLVQVMAGTGLY